jgi:hypothetical protein
MKNGIFSTAGLGVRGHNRNTGRFEVRTRVITSFRSLEEAYEFFKHLDEEATLWDMTRIPELLESKHRY